MIVNLIHQHADRLMHVGLHLLWQGTAIAILAALASRFLATHPRHRSALYLGALVAVFLCVPVTLMNMTTPSPEPISSSSMPSGNPEFALSPTPQAPPIKVEPVTVQNQFPLSFWIAGIYFAGLLLMMVRVIRGYLWSSKTRRDGQPVFEAPWSDALTQAVTAMKLRSKPVMIWSSNITTPVVTGILRPMIVLPASLMTGLPREQTVAVLCHELAHLRRFDHLIVVFQRLLEALFFFHPAVWFLSHRLDQEREKACDDLVVDSGHNRADYAEALVKVASQQHPTLALAAAKSHHLKERILRILNQPQPTTVRVNSGGWISIVITIASLCFFSLSPAQSQEKENKKPDKIGATSIIEKLQIQIPAIEMTNATLEEAIEFLRQRSVALDPTPIQNQKGINIVFRIPAGNKAILKTEIDSLVAKNFTIQEALVAICKKTKTRFKVDEFAVTIVSAMDPEDPNNSRMVDRRWTVPPNFLKRISTKDTPPNLKDVVKLFEARGITFAKGSSASYLPDRSLLTARNTPQNLDLIDAIIKAIVDPEGIKKELGEIQKIIIPKLDFQDATLQEAVDFLRRRALDDDPAKKGVNINIFGGGKDLTQSKISNLNLTNVPLPIVLKYVCELTKTRYTLEGRNISIVPIKE